MDRPKFDKSKCLRCRYSVKISSGFSAHDQTGASVQIVCDYSGSNKDGHTCLYRGADKKVHDRRGDDYNNCLLFTQGKLNKRRSV